MVLAEYTARIRGRKHWAFCLCNTTYTKEVFLKICEKLINQGFAVEVEHDRDGYYASYKSLSEYEYEEAKYFLRLFEERYA